MQVTPGSMRRYEEILCIYSDILSVMGGGQYSCGRVG